MEQHDIHTFLLRFFKANQCSIIEESAGHMTVQLTIEMDKLIMNRPFYWHWLEKTGGVPEPRQLTFITDQKKAGDTVSGEFIHFGSPGYFKYLRRSNNRDVLSGSMNESARSRTIRSHLSHGLVSM